MQESGYDFPYREVPKNLKRCRRFQCPHCKYHTMHAGWLRTHIALVHTQPDDRFECGLCHRFFSCKGSFLHHQARYATPYLCFSCDEFSGCCLTDLVDHQKEAHGF